MERHPVMGYGMIRNIEFLAHATDVVLCAPREIRRHRLPDGLRGDAHPAERADIRRRWTRWTR